MMKAFPERFKVRKTGILVGNHEGRSAREETAQLCIHTMLGSITFDCIVGQVQMAYLIDLEGQRAKGSVPCQRLRYVPQRQRDICELHAA